jgi:hypothetical protein
MHDTEGMKASALAKSRVADHFAGRDLLLTAVCNLQGAAENLLLGDGLQ